MDIDFDESLRKAFNRAAEERGTAAIARALDVHRQRLYDFASKGVLGKATRNKLHGYLVQNGYFGSEKAASMKAPTLAQAIAAELRALAAVLESDETPDELKGERFISLIKSYAAGIDRYGKRLKKGIDTSGGGSHEATP